MKIETSEQSKFLSVTIKVGAPHGNMFVCIMEDAKQQPVGVQIFYGKAGTETSCWAAALSRTCSLVLDRGGSINDLIAELSEIRSDRARHQGNGVVITSDIEALNYALMQYRREKSERDHGNIYSQYRSPRLGRRSRPEKK